MKPIEIDLNNLAFVKQLSEKFPMNSLGGSVTCQRSMGGYVCTRPLGHQQPNFHVAHRSDGVPVAVAFSEEVKVPEAMQAVAALPPQVTIKPPKPPVPCANDVVVVGVGRFLVLDRFEVIRLAKMLEKWGHADDVNFIPTLAIHERNTYLTWLIFDPATHKLEKADA